MASESEEIQYRVRAGHCDHRASAETVYETLCRITEPLSRSWERLEKARRIVIKANVVWPPDRLRCVDGRKQELVDEVVLRGVLRLLRERTTAEIVLADTTQERDSSDVYFLPLLREFGVQYIECNPAPLAVYEVPGGGNMFTRYRLSPCFKAADAVVSLATLKSHAFMGVTLTTKNLFGLCPINHQENRPRHYFHHIIRLPYVLADLAAILRPCLNIVDGLVGQSGREWGGQAQVADVLVAGDNGIATDACAATLMGNDPSVDWPEPPFRRDRNHLRVAAEYGVGTVDLSRIDFQHDVTVPVAQFNSDPVDPSEVVNRWRHTMCQQALFYREHEAEFVAKYPGEYLYLQDGEVIFHDVHPYRRSRRDMSGVRKDSAIWLKRVDPENVEGEHYEVYEREMARMPAAQG